MIKIKNNAACMAALFTFFIIISEGCQLHPGGSGGSNSSQQSQSSSPYSSSSSSGIYHPLIYNDAFKTNWSQATLIYMMSACSLQLYAFSNINLMPTPLLGTNKLFIYIDASVNYSIFPSWMLPGGLFVINYGNVNTNYTSYVLFNGITCFANIYTNTDTDRFDRVFMPSDPDACDTNTLYQVMNFIKTNYSISNLTTLVFWGHGDGWIPLNGGSIGPVNLSISSKLHLSKSVDMSVGINDNSGNTLYDDQIAWAISNAIGIGSKVVCLGFDTCYMGNLEDIYTYITSNYVTSLCEFIIASPGIEANIGWNYTWVANPNVYFANNLMPTNTGVNLSDYGYLIFYKTLPYLDSIFQGFSANNPDIEFWITNSRKYITPSTDPTAHYVNFLHILSDLANYDSTLLSTYNNILPYFNSGNESNMMAWIPVFPKQYYNSFVQKYHSATYIRLFRDDPNMANWFTNSAYGQTQNSVYRFIGINFFSPGYNLWNTLGTILSGGSVNITGSYYAYFLDQRNENQTVSSAISLSSNIIIRTNVAFIAGEGQVDYYSINVTSAGYLRLRISVCTTSNQNTVSNIQLLNSSQSVLQDLTSSLRNAIPSDGGALAASYTGNSTIPVTQNTEYGNMQFAEIYTNFSVGVYYFKISAQDLMSLYYNPTDAPYLIYPMPLTNGETAAVVQ